MSCIFCLERVQVPQYKLHEAGLGFPGPLLRGSTRAVFLRVFMLR